MKTWWRKLLKRLHPEGIPWPGSFLYNLLSGTEVFQRHYELVAKDVERYGKAERILDIGTGPGYLLIALSKVFPNAKLDGIDISKAMVAQAEKNIKACGQEGGIEVKTAAASALPFANCAFDRVVSTGSLHHWKKPLASLNEAYRILKPGGYALIYDLVRNMPEDVGRKVKAEFGRFRFTLLWLHSFEEPFLNAGEMESLGRQSDFEVKGTEFIGALCCLVLQKL